MRTSFERIGLAALMALFFGVPISLGGEDLIAPTRSLERPAEPLAKLTVVSEPPDLEVFFDGSKIGHTPIWLKEVEPGPHKLRVRESEANVYVEPGRTVTLSFFRGSFIDVSKERESVKQAGPDPEKPTEGRRGIGPAEEERVRDLTPWERFLNRSSPNF